MEEKIARCWNCTQFNSCDDYKTFAYGCLRCSHHEMERNTLKAISNFFNFIKLIPPEEKCPTDRMPLPITE